MSNTGRPHRPAAPAQLPPLRSLVRDRGGDVWLVTEYFPRFAGLDAVESLILRPPNGGVTHKVALGEVEPVPVEDAAVQGGEDCPSEGRGTRWISGACA